LESALMSLLSRHEGKALAEFQQEGLQVLDQRLLQAGFEQFAGFGNPRNSRSTGSRTKFSWCWFIGGKHCRVSHFGRLS
jgi:hypothetical protein